MASVVRGRVNRPKTLGQCAGDFETVSGLSGDWFLGPSNCPFVPFYVLELK